MDDQLVTALQQAVAGLLYSSESDAPWEVFTWADCPSPLTPDAVLAHAAHPAGTPVASQSLDDFFRGLTADKTWYGDAEKATAQRYRDLLALLRQHLPDAQVFRVGKVQVAIYVIGHPAPNRCLGLRTTSVET